MKTLRADSIRSAVRELLIIVVGILLALQVDTWNQARVDRRTAASYLERLENDLRSDSSRLASLRDFSEFSLRVANGVLTMTDATSPPDSLGLFIGAARGVEFFEPRVASYQDMVNTGQLGLIDSVELRDLLIQYHEVETGDWLASWSDHLRRTHWEEYARYLTVHVDPRSIPNPGEGPLPVEFLTDWNAFRADPTLRTAVLNIWAVHEASLVNYEDLSALVNEILEAMRTHRV